jgi:hypothetical protein
MRRREFIVGLGSAAVYPLGARTQQPEVVFKGQICPAEHPRDLFEAVQRKLSEQWLSQRPGIALCTYPGRPSTSEIVQM